MNNRYHEDELYLYGKSIQSGEWMKLTLCRSIWERNSRYDFFRDKKDHSEFKWESA